MQRLALAVICLTCGVLVAQDALVFPPRKGEYRVLPLEVIDGDTVRFAWLIEDVGRLYGINAPEMHGDDADKGLVSKKYLASILPQGACKVVVHGREKYGRSLLEFFDAEGKSISRRMVDGGKAKAWDGTGKRP